MELSAATARGNRGYEAAGACQPALDFFGQSAQPQRLRRIVPDHSEYATAERPRQLRDFTRTTAGHCVGLLQPQIVKMDGLTMVFGGVSDLEVEGHCFDAPERTYSEARALRWLTALANMMMVMRYRVMQGKESRHPESGGSMIATCGLWAVWWRGARRLMVQFSGACVDSER